MSTPNKYESRAYREYMVRRVQGGDVILSKEIRVNHHATVHTAPDGAFVEVQVWIPRSMINDLIEEMEEQRE